MYRLVTRPSAIRHEVICLGTREWYGPLLEEQGVPIRYFGLGPFRSASRMFSISAAVKDARPDIVQGWMYRSNLLGGLAARGAGVPCVWGIHCSSLDPLPFRSRLWVYVGGAAAPYLADYVINCSKRSAELHQRLGFGRVPGRVIPNGYDPEAFYPDDERREKLRAELGIEHGTFVVGAVARWHRQKDIPNLLHAVRLAVDDGVPIKCLLVGHELGPENAELAAAIRDARCEALATCLGRRTDIADLARAFDLHVLPSSGGEAFPNSVSETMLSGTPNVVTDVGDSAFIVADTGWTVPPSDAQALKAAIAAAHQEFASDHAAWQERRRAARQRIADNFTFDRMAADYEEVWSKVARSREPMIP
jgi:glycosyltransferase involved in cell wall biosynthesis